MFGFLTPKEDSLEEVEARIAAKEKVMALIGKASINDLQTLEDLYYKQTILRNKQPSRGAGEKA